MTTTTEQGAAPVLNGAAPPAPDAGPAPADGAITMGERLMGVIGIAFAVGLLAIGIDLMTGGALARMLGAGAAAGDGEPGAGAGG